MTKAQLITDLENMIGPGIEVDGDGLTTWLNDAYLYMVDELTKANPDYFAKAATADLVAGQQEYDLPTDFERVLMANVQYDGSSWSRALPLENIGNVPIHSRTDSTQGFNTSAPSYYIFGDNIGLMPIPGESVDEGLKLWYVYTPEELDADSDEPAFPKKFHHILKYGAYANYLDQDDEHVAAENMRRRFDDRIARMVESMSSNQDDQPKSVQISNGQDLYVDEYDW